MNSIIAYGSTQPGRTAWKSYGSPPGALYVDVDTSEAGFVATPKYMTSLGGNSQHWDVVGVTSIYSPTPKGFRVYIKPPLDKSKSNFEPNVANRLNWHVNWIAIGAVDQG